MPKKILIAEDSPTMRSLIVSAIAAMGDYEIVEAANGFEALRILPREKVDLVITDINMPDINGLELVSFIKNNPNYKSTPLFIISTEGSERDREKGLAWGPTPIWSNLFLRRPAGVGSAAFLARRHRAGKPFIAGHQGFSGRSRRDHRKTEPRSGDARRHAARRGECDPELLNGIFRGAHSIKGLRGCSVSMTSPNSPIVWKICSTACGWGNRLIGDTWSKSSLTASKLLTRLVHGKGEDENFTLDVVSLMTRRIDRISDRGRREPRGDPCTG